MDSVALGQFVLPAFESLPRKLPNYLCAVLCTPDGFNLCSIGIGNDQLGKIAALSSSLMAVSEATLRAVQNDDTDCVLDTITLQAGDVTTVSIKVPHVVNYLVLIISARATPLGVLLNVARSTAAQVRELMPVAG